MNEKIREIAEQSGVKFIKASIDYFGYRHPPDMSTDDIDLDKFVALIVQECCQFNYDFLESYSEACEVNGKIREHLGVK